jgi:hypothetical protein
MARRSLTYKWNQEDGLTRAKWMRAVAIFYGCIGLLAKPGVPVSPVSGCSQCRSVPENFVKAVQPRQWESEPS